MQKKTKQVNHTLSSDRKKKKHTFRNIILGTLGFIVLLLAAVIIFRNPIVETVAEKVLTKSLKTPVTINKLHIALLTPGISIEQVTIDHKTDPTAYMLKTGLIKISVQIAPYLSKKFISVPELILDNITLGAPKPSNEIRSGASTADNSVQASVETSDANESDEKKGNLSDLIGAIDADEIIDKYLSDIDTLSEIDGLEKEVDTFYKDSQDTIDQSIASTDSIETKYNSLSKDLSSVSIDNIDSVNSIVGNVQSLIGEGQQITQQIIAIQEKGEGYVNKSVRLSNSLSKKIKEDSDKIIAQVTNPKELGLDLAIQIVEDMLDADIKSYEKMLVMALELLVDMKHSLDNPDDKEKNEDKAPLNFLVGYFRLSFGLGLDPLFNIEASNITNKLYTSVEPTEFTILATAHAIAVEGDGSLSLHPAAPKMFTAKVHYAGIPLEVDAIPIVEIQSIEGEIEGSVDLEYVNSTNGKLEVGISVVGAEVDPIEDSTFGPHIADGIEKNYPIDIIVSGEAVDGELTNLKVESTFFDKIRDVMAQILQEQLDALTADLQAKIQEAIREQTEAKLEEISDNLGISNDAIREQVAAVADVNGNVSELFSDANKKVAEAVQSQVKEEVQKVIEDVVDEVKSLIPSF